MLVVKVRDNKANTEQLGDLMTATCSFFHPSTKFTKKNRMIELDIQNISLYSERRNGMGVYAQV